MNLPAGQAGVTGEPFVIEYNTRMGDPETQSVMARIESDFLELLCACAQGKLRGKKIEVNPEYALTIVLASDGYPDEYEKGKVIDGLAADTKALVFHAGTKTQNNEVLTDGGRVLGITGRGKTLKEAQANAYAAAEKINWDGVYYRWDIGADLM